MDTDVQRLIRAGENWTIVAKLHGYTEDMYEGDIKKDLVDSLVLNEEDLFVVGGDNLAAEYKGVHPQGPAIPVENLGGMSVLIAKVPESHQVIVAGIRKGINPCQRAVFHVRSFTKNYPLKHGGTQSPMRIKWNKPKGQCEYQASFCKLDPKFRDRLQDKKFTVLVEPLGHIGAKGFQRYPTPLGFNDHQLVLEI